MLSEEKRTVCLNDLVIKNRTNHKIEAREIDATQPWILESKSSKLLTISKKVESTQLVLRLGAPEAKWSLPFTPSGSEEMFVKLAEPNGVHRAFTIALSDVAHLSTLEISDPTYFPFSLRNETRTEIVFYQSNPSLPREGSFAKPGAAALLIATAHSLFSKITTRPAEDNQPAWRPIRFRLPPRSIMPYAWDYPSAKDKELVLVASGRERHVKLEPGTSMSWSLARDVCVNISMDSVHVNSSEDAVGTVMTLTFSMRKAQLKMTQV